MVNGAMEFIPLYFREKLKVVNSRGTLAVVTLWSDVEHVHERLAEAGADMSREASPIAVMGFLHGEGFRYLLRNLLYNPQIDTLLVIGSDLSGSYEYITSFFERGTEVIEDAGVKYASDDSEDINTVRVTGTNCVMDGLVTLGSFGESRPGPEVVRIEGISDESFAEAAKYIEGYKSVGRTGERREIPVPEIIVGTYPSNVRAHVIVADKPSEAWRRLVHTIYRFGPEVTLKKGTRRELQNVKVIVEEPEFEPDGVIESCGFTPLAFRKYQETILSPKKIDDTTYTYGNRLREYFGIDTLNEIAKKLGVSKPDDRTCFTTTWDNAQDITGRSRPCLATLFFRKMENGRLNLTATFRTHNASNAWLENLYGLMAIQGYACIEAGLAAGAITVISHSISLDPAYLDKASMIAEEVAGKNVFREDPNGYFNITTEGDEIVLRHMSGPFELGEYRGHKPEAVQFELYRNLAISDINHAMYVGRQLQKAYRSIIDGETYVQD